MHEECYNGGNSVINLEHLKTPFPEDDIEWRVGSCGKKKNGDVWCMVLAYVTSRAIMDRLDSVCGIENWKNQFAHGPDGGVICGISIRIGDEWVTKWDGAENTQIESVKGGLSDSMKRCGVQWGIGRYLYKLPDGWGVVGQNAKFKGKTKCGQFFRWNPPGMPSWARPPVQEVAEATITPQRQPEKKATADKTSTPKRPKYGKFGTQVSAKLKEAFPYCKTATQADAIVFAMTNGVIKDCKAMLGDEAVSETALKGWDEYVAKAINVFNTKDA